MNKIPKEKWHDSQRGYFAASLYNLMIDNEEIFVLTGDLGYAMFDSIKADFPDRFVNCGAAEQSMVGIAVGLALAGKKVFCYSITPFLLRRAFETIKLYIDHEKIPVILVGGGRDKDYAHDGFSHDATDARAILSLMPNIQKYFPEDTQRDLIPEVLKSLVKYNDPAFLSLRR